MKETPRSKPITNPDIEEAKKLEEQGFYLHASYDKSMKPSASLAEESMREIVKEGFSVRTFEGKEFIYVYKKRNKELEKTHEEDLAMENLKFVRAQISKLFRWVKMKKRKK